MSASAQPETDDIADTDAFIRDTFQEGRESSYPKAARRYLRLIELADSSMSETDRAVVDRHIAQMVFLLDDDWHPRIIEPAGPGGPKLKNNAGALLASWWRRQDPLPATLWNERIAEHLERVLDAEERFAYPRAAAGFDDRGEVYVRLGEPSAVEYLTNTKLLTLTAQDAAFIPENEVWTYEHLGPHGHFIFVSDGGFRLASTTIELMPTRLRFPWDTKSSPRRSGIMAFGLEEFYRQLTFSNRSYMSMWVKLREVTDAQREAAIEARSTVARLLSGAGVSVLGERTSVPGMGIGLLNELKRRDVEFRRLREDTVPRVATDVYEDEPLDIHGHVARFLDEDGSTRAEVYWTTPEIDLPVEATFELLRAGRTPSDGFVFGETSVEYDAAYSAVAVRRNRRSVPRRPGPRAPFTSVLHGIDGDFHVALQVDQYLALGGGSDDLAFVRSGAFRGDSLRALDADPGTLELSDLVLLRGDSSGTLHPLVGPTVGSSDSLALRFEIYHLVHGDGDLTSYRIDYSVTRLGSESFWTRLFGGAEEVMVSGATTNQGSSRTAAELVVLGLGALESGDELNISVSVTDLVSGSQKSRSVRVGVADE